VQHSFYRIESDEVEAVINVASSSEWRLALFVRSMVQKGWTLSKVGAGAYRSFSEDAQRTRVLGTIRATYKVRRRESVTGGLSTSR
jgi:hypothetical protein